MKCKIVLFIVVFTVVVGCKNNTIELNGQLDYNLPGDYIYLDELKSDVLVTVDSVKVREDNTFIFNREVVSPSFYLIKTDNSNFLTMLLEPGQKIKLVTYRDSLSSARYLTGSPGTKLLLDYNLKLQETIRKLRGLHSIYMENIDKPDLQQVMERLDSLAQAYLTEINTFTKEYIDKNLASLVTLVALYQQVAPGEYVLHPQNDLRYFIKVDSSLFLRYPDYEPVKALHEQVAKIVAENDGQSIVPPPLRAGSEAPEITLANPEGDTISLSSTRGSVVLLDFWAAWCGPCRSENPNLVTAYNLYHSRGFQIFQVSLDKTREAWIKGIEDDGLGRWIHVSDIKYWNSVVVPLYKIESIPANFLLDREGRIIASNLRGEELRKALAGIFTN